MKKTNVFLNSLKIMGMNFKEDPKGYKAEFSDSPEGWHKANEALFILDNNEVTDERDDPEFDYSGEGNGIVLSLEESRDDISIIGKYKKKIQFPKNVFV